MSSRKQRERSTDEYVRSAFPSVKDHESIGGSAHLFLASQKARTVRVGRDDFRVYQVAVRLGAHVDMALIEEARP